MSTQIFVNLPVANLEKATTFYEALGFIKKPEFSNSDASWLEWDNHIFVMLLTHNFAKTFIPNKTIADSHKTCEVFNALKFESKEDVIKMYNKAIESGGKESCPAYDHGFMYGHDFEDLDGHIREPFWMDANGIPKE